MEQTAVSTAPVSTPAQSTTNVVSENPSTTNGVQLQKPNVDKPSAPTVQEKQYYELKANGRTHKLTLDEMRGRAELGMAAYEKFEAAAQKEKAVQNWKETAKKDVMKALMDPELGLSKIGRAHV